MRRGSGAAVSRAISLRDSRTCGRLMAIRISRSAMRAEGLWNGKKKSESRGPKGAAGRRARTAPCASALQRPPRLARRLAPLRLPSTAERGWAARGGPLRRESRAGVGRAIILRDSRTRGRLMAIRISRSATSAEGLWNGKKKARRGVGQGGGRLARYSALQRPPRLASRPAPPALRRPLPWPPGGGRLRGA